MKLWTEKVRAISDDVLLLARHLLKTQRTFFVARTDDRWFEVLQVSNDGGSSIGTDTRLPIDESYCGILYRTRQDVLQIENAESDSRVADKKMTRMARIGSYLDTRIQLASGETFGTLCAVDPRRARFETAKIEAFQSLARILSRALDAEILAYHDVLSGLFNRAYFNELLQEARDSDVRVILIDIDNFKNVNDEFGHERGDELIRFVGHTLKHAFAGADIMRLGGDEFCVIEDATPLSAPDDRIMRVMRTFAAFPGYGVTVSCGVAQGPPGQIEALVSRADRALYRAKYDGKNCCRFAEIE